CDESPAPQGLAWGLVNEVVPRRELDAAVEDLTQKLVRVLPEVTRYTKQQLNFWRDLSWHLTVGHARDWLTLHAGSPETQEGLEAFHENRPVDYAGIRRRLAEGPSTEYRWGSPTRTCPSCGARHLPEEFTYCGQCGRKLSPRDQEAKGPSLPYAFRSLGPLVAWLPGRPTTKEDAMTYQNILVS